MEINNFQSEFYETENSFGYSFLIDVTNNTQDYIIPVLNRDIFDGEDLMKIDSLTEIELRPGDSIDILTRFTIRKDDLTEEQIKEIRKANEKIVTDFVLGTKVFNK